MEGQHGETGTQPVDRASLPVVPAGQHLVEHEVYLDVASLGHGPCVAMAGQTAGSGNAYVAQRDVTPEVWDHLLREDGEARLRREAEAAAISASDASHAGAVQ